MSKDDEQYAPYEDYADQLIWPAVGPGGELKLTHIDEMAPQHAASALHKLRRYVYRQWSTDLDGNRAWHQWQRSTLFRALSAQATGLDDLSEAVGATVGLSDKQAVLLVARTLLEGAGDHQEPMEIVAEAQRLVGRLYQKGFVILPRAT